MQDVEHPTIQIGQFAIKTEVFSGPLELLLSLIEKRKLLINDISIASVTDDYIRYVSMIEQNQFKETAQFVTLASTLLLIKSKSLLPVFSLTDEETESIEDLQYRLKEYQIFKDAGKSLENIFGNNISYERKYIQATEPFFITDKYTKVQSLNESIKEVLTRLPKKTSKPKVRVQKIISLEEMISKLRNRVEQQFKFGFTDFTENSKEKNIIVVGFLAVLEMVKQGNVMARQTSSFTEIEIEREVKTNQLPRYI